MGLFKKYVNQVRKPEGLLGQMMIDTMNGGHAKMADWGMDHLHSIAPANLGGNRIANLTQAIQTIQLH